ncbi:solute carrier family 26 member 6 [Tiliqua scincoides]|uniref:solute carrier family 26 member 6 n=1 Tax=Tiliqua scincoides TaxID=71010 RepID=UPI0034620A26
MVNQAQCDPPGQHSVLSEADIERVGLKTEVPPSSFCTEIKKIRCSCSVAKSLLFKYIPILRWLPRYPVKEWLIGDIISGFSVGIMHLPQGLAYALLAGLPPVLGLYTAFYPVLIYFFFGTSRHISVGPFAVISVMIGSVTDSLEPSENYMEMVEINGTNTTFVNETRRDAARVELVTALTFLVGIFQIALGLLQFGFVATYLSEPLVRGYTTAASIQVLISQLKYVFGVPLKEYSGPLSLIYTLVEICARLPQTNVGTLVTALIAMVFILLVKILNDKLGKKLPVPIPVELLTIILSTVIFSFADLSRFEISNVGDIPSGMRPPEAPNVNYFERIVGNAFAIAMVGYVICISLGKTFGLKHGYSVDSNQELIALGLSNFVGSFFRCYSISCSMSRTLVQESTGGNSQVAGVISCIVILVTILKIGELFRELPEAILASIIIVNLKGMFKQFNDICSLWKTNFIDLLIWLVTFVATLLLNLDMGLGVAVAFSLLMVIFRSQMPHYSMLGQVSKTRVYRDVAEYHKAEEIPGVKIFHSSATVYFANAGMYAEAIKKKCGMNVDRLIEKKKKALKKKHKQEKKEAKKAKKIASKVKQASGSGNNNLAFVEIDMDRNIQKEYDTAVTGPNGSAKDLEPPVNLHPEPSCKPTLESLGLEKPPFHSLILDFSSANFVDTVCIKTLKNIFKDFRDIEVDVYLVGCHDSIITQLEKGNFFSETITKHHLFASVHDAVTFITRIHGNNMLQIDTSHERPDRKCGGVEADRKWGAAAAIRASACPLQCPSSHHERAVYGNYRGSRFAQKTRLTAPAFKHLSRDHPEEGWRDPSKARPHLCLIGWAGPLWLLLVGTFCGRRGQRRWRLEEGQ